MASSSMARGPHAALGVAAQEAHDKEPEPREPGQPDFLPCTVECGKVGWGTFSPHQDTAEDLKVWS